jgi:hypothetical protein
MPTVQVYSIREEEQQLTLIDVLAASGKLQIGSACLHCKVGGKTPSSVRQRVFQIR